MNEMEYAVVDHKGEIVYHDETAIGAFNWAEVNLADDRYTVELMDKPSEPKMTPEQADFAVGDLVVYLPSAAVSVTNVFEIFELHRNWCTSKIDGALLDRGIFYNHIRLATAEEISAGHRIDAPTVCVEQETAELFNTKHCSPRNYNNDSALRVSEIKASVAYSKMALTNFTLSEKNSRLKTNNHALKAALAVAIVAGVVGWML